MLADIEADDPKRSYETIVCQRNDYHKIKIQKNNQQVVHILMNASLGSIFWGYSLLCYNPSQLVMQTLLGLNNDTPQHQQNVIAMITSSLLVGGFFGSILCTIVLKKWSRHLTMVIADMFGILGCLVSIIMPNIYSICVGRAIQGICCGMNTVVVPMYVKEMTPLQLMGLTSILNPGNLFIGQLIAYLFGLGYSQTFAINYYWRIAFAFPLVLCVIRSYYLITKFNFDTPLSLMIKRKKKAAMGVLEYMYNDQYVSVLYSDFQHEAHKKRKRGGFKQLLNKRMYKKTLIGLFLMYLTQLMGQNCMTFYSSRLYNTTNDVNILDTRIHAGIGHVLSCAFVILTAFLVQMYGKKKIVRLCIIFLLLISLSLSIFWYQAYKYSEGNLSANYDRVPQYIWTTISILLICFKSNIALGTIAPMFGYISDIQGDMGMMVSQCVYWFFVIIIAVFFVEIDYYISFLIFSVNTFICLLAFWFLIADTKGMSRKEMEMLYAEPIRNRFESAFYQLERKFTASLAGNDLREQFLQQSLIQSESAVSSSNIVSQLKLTECQY